jgi:RNA polymerase sigma factor (TIGR02999 family)
MSGRGPELTALLADWRRGDQEAGHQLMTAAYEQLHRLAAHRLRHERSNHTLQATELISELYLKLFSSGPVNWQDRAHFLAVAARQLRRILVDHARMKGARKRGGTQVKVSLTSVQGLMQPTGPDILEIDDALKRLEVLAPRAAAGVELRFFGGLTETEIVAVLGISLATLHRDWKFSRAWLIAQLTPMPR